MSPWPINDMQLHPQRTTSNGSDTLLSSTIQHNHLRPISVTKKRLRSHHMPVIHRCLLPSDSCPIRQLKIPLLTVEDDTTKSYHARSGTAASGWRSVEKCCFPKPWLLTHHAPCISVGNTCTHNNQPFLISFHFIFIDKSPTSATIINRQSSTCPAKRDP